MRGHFPAIVFALLSLAWSVGSAHARPPHKQSLKRYYGDHLSAKLFACATCHFEKSDLADPAQFDPEYPPHNPFGERLSGVGEELEAAGQPSDMIERLRRVAPEDADGDGVANQLELLAGTNPGKADDVPSSDRVATAQTASAEFDALRAVDDWQPFRPVKRPPIPQPREPDASQNPIDLFVAHELKRNGLKANPAAPPHVLLRRVYIDLIGLPPTRAELHAFLSDPSPVAYEGVVDRLLDDPRHGQRWARHWMDIWRYSDWAGWTDGKQIRDSQPHIWRWRDWIVDSLNEDKPYDRMIAEMVAADELWPDDENALRATGFLARNYKMLSRETWLQETVEHTAKALLGMTLNCARCHDHMYDPIAQEEYYQFRAIFEPHQVRLDRLPGQSDTSIDGLARVFDGTPDAATYVFERGDDRKPDTSRAIAPGVPSLLHGSWKVEPAPLPLPAHYPAMREFVQNEMLAAAEAKTTSARQAFSAAVAALAAGPRQEPPADFDALETAVATAALALTTAGAEQASLVARRAAERAKYGLDAGGDLAALAAAASHAERAAEVTRARGALAGTEEALRAATRADEMAAPDKKAEANAALAQAAKARDDARTALAAAETALANPPQSYTALGEVYPAQSTGRRTALARWLADRQNPLVARVAVNHVWRRHLGRGLVATTFDFGQNGAPPTHPRLLDWLAAEFMSPKGEAPAWSFKRLHRLIVTSDVYRQSSMSDVARNAIDPENRFYWRFASRRMEAEAVRDSVLYVSGQLDTSFGGPDIDHAQGQANARRSLYFRHAAEKQMEFLKLFDAAAVTECYERKESIVPQQALALANSELAIRQARLLARSLAIASADQQAPFVAAAFEQVLSRPATDEEMRLALTFLDEQATRYAQTQQLAAGADPPPVLTRETDPARPATEPIARARENFVHVLLNHHEFVTIR